MKRWSRRLLALCLGLLLAEAALRVVGMVWLSQSGRQVTVADGAGLCVMCVGDSNTFGLFLDAHEAYPAKLEALLRGRQPSAAVVNLGVPGRDSGALLRELPGQLERYRPEVVLVTIGANNGWTWQPPEAGASPPWWESWRLVKTVRLLAERGRPRELPSVLERREVGPTAKEAMPGLPTPERTIESDLTAIVDRIARFGAEVVVMSYGSNEPPYDRANRAIRTTCESLDREPVEHWQALAELGARIGQRNVLFPDGHPTALGYSLIARRTYNALVRRGIVAGEELDALAGLTPPTEPAALLRLVEDEAGRQFVEFEGAPPGADYFLLLSGAQGQGSVDLDGLPLPLFDDPLARYCLDRLPFAGAFDATGRARVAIGRAHEFVEGDVLRAVYVLPQGVAGWPYPWVSPPAALTAP